MSDKLQRLTAISEQIAALDDQMTELQRQYYALEPSLDEMIESNCGRWRGAYAHYDAEHDLLHVFFEDRPAVSSWREDGVHVQYDAQDPAKVVGVTLWGCRRWVEKQARKEKP